MTHQPVLPMFEAPQSPDLAPILELHDGHDGHVTFHCKDDHGEHQDLWSIPAKDLAVVWPSVKHLLEKDSYHSIHGFYKGGHGIARNSPPGLGLKRAYRRSDGVRWLTCAFADIDCHNLGIDIGTAIGAVISAQDEGTVPPASMITRSGRGIWAFWCLSDKAGGPERAWPERTQLWSVVQREITNKFAVIGADAAARDVSRITRIPGSINTKAVAEFQRVQYWLQVDSDGRRYRYELDTLAKELNVSLPKAHPALAMKYKDLALTKRGRKGQAGRWLKARQQFEQLWSMRGTWKQGTRNNAVFIYASILRSQRLDESVVWEELWRLYQDIEAPFTSNEVKTAAASGRGYPRFGGMKNQTISDMLDVTIEEAQHLETWKPASRFGECIPMDETLVGISREERREKRRQLIQFRILHMDGVVPTIRDMQEWLVSKGVPCTPATVRHDYKEVGAVNPRGHSAIRRKKARSRQRRLKM